MSRRRIAPVALAGVTVAIVATCVLLLASTARIVARPHVGDQTYYRFAYRGEGVDEPGAVFSATGNHGRQRTYTQIGGVLIRTIVGVDDAGSTVVWNLVDARVDYRGGVASLDALSESALQSAMQRPYVTRFASDGRAVAFAAAPGTNGFAKAFLRALFGRLQIVSPAHPSYVARDWQVAEPDLQGSHRATYTLDRFGNGVAGDATFGFTRSSELIENDAPHVAIVGHPTVVGFDTDRGTLDGEGGLVALHSLESQTVLYGARTIARSQSHIDLDRVSTATLDASRVETTLAFARARLASPDAGPLHVVESDRAVADRAARTELGDATETSLEKQIRVAVPNAHTDVRSVIAAKVAALMYVHPATVERIARIAQTAAPSGLPFGIVATALSRVDTPRSQAAIGKVLLARQRDAIAGPALALVLASSRAPTAASITALERVANSANDDSAHQAELALGAIARTLRGRDQGLVARIVDRLDRRLVSASVEDVAARETELSALGNAAADRSLPTLLAYRADPQPLVRAGVARALRAIEDTRADDALFALLGDRLPAVRLAAAVAFADRQPSLPAFRALETTARRDTDRDVRANAALALWNARATYPEASAIVREIARADPDRSVRSTTSQKVAESSNDLPEGVVAPDAQLR